MKCVKCGAELAEGARFCGRCGTSIEQAGFCSTCGAKLQPGQIFCTSCGMKLRRNNPIGNASSSSVNIGIKQPPNVTISRIPSGGSGEGKGTGQLLRKMNLITKYYGEPTVGLANKVGTLSVYDNRVEFSKKAGLSLAGTVSALAKSEVEVYYLRDVFTITTGRYMGMYITLVLVMKNGNKISFCPSVPGSKDMEMIATLLLRYL